MLVSATTARPGRSRLAKGDHLAEAYAQIALGVIAMELEVTASEVLSASRRQKVTFARQIAMYLLHVLFRLNPSRVGRAFGRDRTTVCHAFKVIEDKRDDPKIDAQIEAIEQSLLSLPELDLSPPRLRGRPRRPLASE